MTDPTAVGMNLAGNSFYSTEFPFINRVKSASGWFGQGIDSSTIPLDSNGYPTGIPAGATAIGFEVPLDPLSAGTDSTYVFTYSGTGNFTLVGASIISSEPGKITFRWTLTDSNQMLVAVNGINSSSPLGNMAIVRSDQVDLYNQGDIFNPEFLSKVSPFNTLRYMDWEATNLNTSVNWSDRTTPNSMSWQSTATSGVPIETMVALANQTHTNMWLNVPTQATDDYVRQMMTYVHNNLDPTLSVSLEYSNEVWNWGFQQSHYALTKGDQLWGTDANGDGTIDSSNPAEHFAPGWVTYYGYRAAQIANIANQVFGSDDSRVHNVLGTQTTYLGLENYILDGVARANLGSVSSLFDDYAITTYFGDLDGGNATDKATILSWARSGDAGVTAAIAAIKNGTGLTDGTNSLAYMLNVYAYQAAVASRVGLNLVAYEGGIGLSAQNYSGTDQTDVQSFFARIDADPRMGDLYTQMLSDFSAAGGTLANDFSDVGPDSVLGTWGTLKSLYDNGSPAYNALVAAAQAQSGESTSSGTGATSATGTTTTPVAGGSTTTSNQTTTSPVTTGTTTTTGGSTTSDSSTTTSPVTTGTTTTTGGSTTSDSSTTRSPVTTGTTTTTGGSTTSDSSTTTSPVTNGITSASGSPTTSASGTSTTSPTSGSTTITTPVTTPAQVVTAVLAAGQTDQASYTLGASETTITYVGSGVFTAVGNNLGDTITAGDGGSKLTGGLGNDTLIGGAGSDFLDGGGGVDRMVGGAGDDTYAVGDYRDQVVELAGGGDDTIRTSLSVFTLTDNVENLTYVGANSFQAMGNGLDNIITGGQGPNRLSGGAGNDTLIGGGGDDILDGGTGADRMVGGAGNDIYFVDNPGDQVVEDPNGGTDTVFSSISYVLPDNVENLTLLPGATSGTGNALDNVITANAGNDVLTGSAGADRFVFRAGALNVDPTKTSTITDFSRSDGDKIDLSGIDANAATAAVDAFTFIGTAAFDGHAGELRVDTSGAYQVVYGDLTGDGVADFALNVSKGSGTLISSDFIL